MTQDGQLLRRLRVAVLNRVFSAEGGGAETYSIRLVERLAGRHDVHVFAQEVGRKWPGVTFHLVSCPLRKPRWLNQLWYALASWRATRQGFDVVHSHENTWHGEVHTVHVRPVRYNLLTGYAGWRLALRWLKIAISPRLLSYLLLEGARFRDRPGRQIAVTSPLLKDQVLAAYPAAAARISVVTPGVNPPGEERAPDSARRRLGLPPTGPLVLFVANDYGRKGLDTLLQAMAMLPPDTLLAVVGKPIGAAAWGERAHSLGLDGQVIFLGSMKDVGPAYRAADVLAHPTLDDTFAMVVLEAMANGLPVVVSGPAQCGVSGLLADGEQALLLKDPRDAVALAAALQRVLAGPFLAQRLAEQGRQFALEHSWEAAALAYDRLYFESLKPPA